MHIIPKSKEKYMVVTFTVEGLKVKIRLVDRFDLY
jgi:hypothetical protein